MKAAVLTAPYEITVEKRGMPQIQGPQDVLFKILQTGICGSDMLAFRGGHKTVQYPRVLGHECVGEVVAVGYEAEKKFLPGDLVTVHAIRAGTAESTSAPTRNLWVLTKTVFSRNIINVTNLTS